MKSILVLLLSLLTVFTAQKQTYTASNYSVSQSSKTSQIASNAGESMSGGHCNAIHINPSDPQAYLPDPKCTPGVTNQNVTQNNINSTICKSGYTKTIRPPVSYTDQLKRTQMQEYNYTDINTRDYEEDHFIPLEIGGNPSDPKNLWPEPHPSINEKDLVEDYLNKQVCNGTMTLAAAQKEITQNWYSVYQSIK